MLPALLLTLAPVPLAPFAPAAPAAPVPGGRPPQSPAPRDIPADTEVVTTPSGLAYSVLAPGEGTVSPAEGDRVRVHFTGWLADGKVFETTRGGKPALLQVGKAIDGWNEALQLMRAGSRWKLTVPPELAYGAVGRPPQIPSNATLVFEMEIVEVLPMPAFHPAGEQTATPSGLRYEVLREGSGERVSRNHIVVVRYALWNQAGDLLDCSEMNQDHRIKSKLRKVGDFGLPFLEEALGLMSPGAHYRFEVPPEQCFGSSAKPGLPADSTTVWELELEQVLVPLPEPDFATFDPDRLEKLESGLEHYVERAGDGRKPDLGDEVTVHYIGWLVNGTVFDDSYRSGEPAVMRLQKQVPGLLEGLQRMREGGVHVFRMPHDLAYGQRGQPPYIGPYATLIFRVELLSVDPR